jgi:hypothetical protein
MLLPAPRAYWLQTTTQSEPQVVYECIEDDFGEAYDETFVQQSPCLIVTLDPHGGYPSFTVLREQLRAVEVA